MGPRFSVGLTAGGIALLCSGVRPAVAQLELPMTPLGPAVVEPVLLKEERAVAQGAESVRILVVGDPGVRDGGWADESDRERKDLAGNPGDYREPPLPFAIRPGRAYRTLLDTKIEGVADLHVGGHEHNLQFWAPTGASATGALTASAVVGSAAKCTGPGKRLLNSAMQIEAYNYGFAVLEASSDTLALEFHLVDGARWDSWRVRRGRSGDWHIGIPSPHAVDRPCRSSGSRCPTPSRD